MVQVSAEESVESIRNHYARDTHARSWLKTLTWRVIATAVTIVGVGVATGDWALAGGLGALLNLVKAGLYYVHERIWEKTRWGREYIQEDK